MRIGFIGLGVMGQPMVRHLLAADHDVTVHRVTERSQNLITAGATGASSPADVASHSDVVILMLPDTPDVDSVLFGENGVVAALSPKSLVIDMSSISPTATVDFARRVEAAGSDYLDAPVSGGETGAREATLTIMVGGRPDVFDRAVPIFDVLGRSITHIGEAGAGQIAKVANQIVVGLTIEAVGEALMLASRAGVDPAVVRTALMGGLASSKILDVHGQRMIDRTFQPGFRLRLHRKDLSLALETAKELGLSLPNTALTAQLMNSAVAQGDAESDHSALIRSLERASGI